jgi:hypothetical protein
VPIDDIADVALWQRLNTSGLNGTPLYFRPFLEAKPGRVAAAICAIARAAPGGVLFHCAAGRDRRRRFVGGRQTHHRRVNPRRSSRNFRFLKITPGGATTAPGVIFAGKWR